jgi:hypothetical protein
VHDLTPIGFILDQISDFRAGTNEIKVDNKRMLADVKAFSAPADFRKSGDEGDDDLSFLNPRSKGGRAVVAPAAANGSLSIGGHSVTVQNHITVHAGAGGASTADEIGAKVAEHVGKTASGQFLGALQQAKATGGY